MAIANQPGFCLERSLHNLKRFSDNFISVFRKLHEGMPVFDFLAPFTDFRCNLIAYHLVMWQLYAIFCPEEIKIDFFDYFCVRGGGQLQTFILPDGKVCSYIQSKVKNNYELCLLKPHLRMVVQAY